MFTASFIGRGGLSQEGNSMVGLRYYFILTAEGKLGMTYYKKPLISESDVSESHFSMGTICFLFV
jgi:hypothetical protein